MTGEGEGVAENAQTEKLGLGDLAIAGILAALTWLLQSLWEFPGLYPGLWKSAAVASFVRPAYETVPGYWTACATFVYRFFGMTGAESVFRLAGHVVLAGIAVCVYFVLREWLAFAMRMRPQRSIRRTLVMRLAALLGAAAFVIADPVWTAGQCLSETAILIALTTGAIGLFFVFLRNGEIKYAYFCSLLLGFLAAESPMGLVLPVVFFSVNIFIIKVMPSLESPFFKPAVIEVGKWHMTFLFIVALVAGIALNVWTFVVHGGVGAVGETMGSVPLTYLVEYWHRLAFAASPSAWLLWTAICLMPFVVATIRFPESADEDQFLSYSSGLIFFFCGVLSFSQSSFLPALWFWTYFPVSSQYFLCVGLFCCAATLALSLTIFGVDALCRNHERLARKLFGDPGEDMEDGGEATVRKAVAPVEVSSSTNMLRRCGIVVVPAFILLMMVPGRVKTTTRRMLSIIDDSLRELVREAGPAKFLFTDGNLDDAIEIASAREGRTLRCFSLMGGGGAMGAYLRTRGLSDDEEDMFSFSHDAGMGLRSWIRDKRSRLDDSAALMGFDLWKRDGLPLPPMGGMLSRPAGFGGEEARLEGVAAAHALAERMLDVHALRGGLNTCTDEDVVQKFLTLQWRMARMCTYRGEAYDIAGAADKAIEEANLAKKLNDKNKIYRQIMETMEKRNAVLLQQLTPREGLQLALVRADFMMGKTYAETIIGIDPDNPDACFALGMFYLKERQLSRAELYLKRCLIRKPKEPAVYNNLAMLQIEQGKFDAARANIEKALAIIPDSAAVMDTKKALDAAIEAAKKPPSAKKPREQGK